MAIVKHLPPRGLPERAAQVYRQYAAGGEPFRRNQAAVFAHVPDALERLLSLPMVLKERETLPQRVVELAIVAVSQMNESDVCIVHHAPNLKREGLSDEAVGSVLSYETNPGLRDVDRLVVEYAIAVTNTPNSIADEMFERLRRHFTESQIVELTLRIALCGFFNRFNDALRITAEESPDQSQP